MYAWLSGKESSVQRVSYYPAAITKCWSKCRRNCSQFSHRDTWRPSPTRQKLSAETFVDNSDRHQSNIEQLISRKSRQISRQQPSAQHAMAPTASEDCLHSALLLKLMETCWKCIKFTQAHSRHIKWIYGSIALAALSDVLCLSLLVAINQRHCK